MPSPPDVILVLSPRMAKAAKRMLVYFTNGEEIHDAEFLGEEVSSEWMMDDHENELLTSTEALVREINDQLSRDAKTVTTLEEELPTSVPSDEGDVARVAAKMAKAARTAVEDDPRGPGDGLGA